MDSEQVRAAEHEAIESREHRRRSHEAIEVRLGYKPVDEAERQWRWRALVALLVDAVRADDAASNAGRAAQTAAPLARSDWRSE